METKELSKLRLKQVALLNGLLVIVMILYFLITSIFPITFAHFFLVLSVLILFQGIFGLVKANSTKSIFPIFEKVAIYEKQKMGNEWYKQRKVSNIWSIVLSCMLFFQSLSHWGYPDRVFQIEFNFIAMLTFVFLILLNISLFLHIKKVDGANSALDLKGYTLKSNIISIILGIVLAFVIISITVFYIMNKI